MIGDGIFQRLSELSIDDENLAYWTDFLCEEGLAKSALDSEEYSSIPIAQIDVDFLHLVSSLPVSGPQMYLVALLFVRRLVPKPQDISCWKEILDHLKPFSYLGSKKKKRVLEVFEKNALFSEKKSRINPNTSIEEWSALVICGELLTSMLTALGILHKNRGYDNHTIRSYVQMFNRLRIPLDQSQIQLSPGLPKMIVTVHSTFRRELVLPLIQTHNDSIYSVLSNAMSSVQQVNAQRIVMLKKLKKGSSVIVAADGKKGEHSATGSLVGRKILFSDGFAWVSWKANCEVVWAFAKCNPCGTGLSSITRTIGEIQKSEISFEEYRETLIKSYFEALEDAIVLYPFDFGLIYPMRLGDPTPRFSESEELDGA